MLRFGQKLFLFKKNSQDNLFLKCISNSVNKIHTSKSWRICESSIQEIKIPVPWGHITAKWWGNPDVQPVVALHGVEDNAATFDRLLPLLEAEAVLAVDMPGHGWSSHIPVGFTYNYMDAICVLRFLIKHYFKWSDSLVLLSHSMGSTFSFVYSALYPDEVVKYISIDCSRNLMSDLPTKTLSSLRESMEKILIFEEKSKPPGYSFEELLEKLYQGRKGPEGRISREACKVLLSRGTSKLPNGKLYLSRDPRLRVNAFGRLTLNNWLELAQKIKCDMLSIQAEKSVVKNDIKGDMYKKSVEIILNNSPKSKHVILPGNHHLHLDDPQSVANEINKFLSS